MKTQSINFSKPARGARKGEGSVGRTGAGGAVRRADAIKLRRPQYGASSEPRKGPTLELCCRQSLGGHPQKEKISHLSNSQIAITGQALYQPFKFELE